jgi:UDP-arabinose 4-epimerase
MAIILVTGGAGYVGSHACKALSAAGHRPVVYDNLSFGHEWAAQWGPLENGDILDRTRLDEVFDEHKPDAVMHFAAATYVRESVENPAHYYRNNVLGSLTLLDAARDHGVTSVVFSSTCAVYGEPLASPIPENTIPDPISPYATTKLAVEFMLRDYGNAYGLRSAVLRYFNAAGADPDARIGEDHNPETHAIPLLIDTALGRRSTFEIFGTDYPTPDGTAIRDYVHVDDLADAHVRAIDHLLNGGHSLTLNLGTGRGQSVYDLINSVEQVSGRSVPVVMGERRPGDPPSLVADPTSTRAILGWEPRWSDLNNLVRTALTWHSKSR